MKTFIVFMALVLVFTCLCINSNDLAKYKQINIALKELAQEAACGGALMTGGSENTKGLEISYDDACAYIDMLIERASKTALFSNGELSYEASLREKEEGEENFCPALFVTISFEPSNPIFHLKQSQNTVITRKSSYEWVNYDDEKK